MGQLIEQRARLARLTQREKQVLDYILKHPDVVCFMTANEIGQTLGMGASSVVRLASKLGFQNYTAMRKALQQELPALRHDGERQQVPYEKLTETRHLTGAQLLEAYTQQALAHIQADTQPGSQEKLLAAADAILEAERVFVVGFRACAGFASTLVTMLTCCRSHVYLVGQPQPVVDQLVGLTKRDLLVAISFSRYSKDTFFAARMAHDLESRLVVMTDSYAAPLAEYADQVILSTVDNFSFFNAYTSFVMNMEKLVLLVGHRSMPQTQERLRQMESYLEMTNQY